MNISEGISVNSKTYIAIVIARFNYFFNEKLLNGAIDTLKRFGKIKEENITTVWVPGAYELPLIVKSLTNNKKYNAIIVLGTIIQGQTYHYKLIANSCATNISSISIQTGIPITLGILIVDNLNQAIDRSGAKIGNKGKEAALSALEMINILKSLKNI